MLPDFTAVADRAAGPRRHPRAAQNALRGADSLAISPSTVDVQIVLVPGSSAVEQAAVNRLAGGSNPSRGAIFLKNYSVAPGRLGHPTGMTVAGQRAKIGLVIVRARH